MYQDMELPNGFQSADFEMRDLQRAADRASSLAKQGLCVHGWRQTFPDGSCKCHNCGKVSTWQELEDERRELLI